MYKKIIVGASMLLTIATCLSGCGDKTKNRETGKIEWPEITRQTKPWTRWWWFGSAVTEKDLAASLLKFSDAGLGGVEVTCIYGVRGKEEQFVEYLSPKWVDNFTNFLEQAKAENIGVDLANASGWPFGGPWIDRDDACKNMVSKVYTLGGGQSLDEIIEYTQEPLVRTQNGKKAAIEQIKEPVTANENMQELALDQLRYKRLLPLISLTANKRDANGFGQAIDLTDKVRDGKLDWVAPEGEWTLCALFQGDHGKMVERAGPGGEGNVIDHFSEKAIKTFLTKFDKAFEGRDISYIRHYFNDSYEVDDAVNESNWTPEFLADFKRINNYDLTQHIPALLGLDTEEMNSRVMYDYRNTVNRLLIDKYTKGWQSWAAAQGKGIRNQGHGSPANVLDVYGASDIPEIEGTVITNLKGASSAAHVTGKNLSSSESATWLNEHFLSNMGDVKNAVDNFLLAGINHIFYHGTPYSPQDAPWPGWLFYAAVDLTPTNSLWDDFGVLNQYVARSQSFLQAGRPANDMLVYFPMADVWSEPGKDMLYHMHSNTFFDDTKLREVGDNLSANGYSWDAISDDQLQDIVFMKSELYAVNNTYKAVLVPDARYMPIATFEKLAELAHRGATVLFYNGLPSDVPGFGSHTESLARMNEIKGKLKFEKNGTLSVAKYGRGQIVVSDDVNMMAAKAGIEPETIASKGLQFIRRVKDDGNFYYFVKNMSDSAFDGWVALTADYGSAAVYNPMTGGDGYALVRGGEGKPEIYLQLKPQESLVLETFRGNYSGDVYPFFEEVVAPVAVADSWNIEFVKGGPSLPAALTVSSLGSWTGYGADYSVFSGSADYSATLPALSGDVDAWRLDLGDVRESAAVYVNDRCVGTLLDAPYVVDIPVGAVKGGDKLTVRVSNLMANRISDMDKRGVEWRIFYNTNFNARFAENRGVDGKFSAKNWSPLPSGLCGEVTVAGVKTIR